MEDHEREGGRKGNEEGRGEKGEQIKGADLFLCLNCWSLTNRQRPLQLLCLPWEKNNLSWTSLL